MRTSSFVRLLSVVKMDLTNSVVLMHCPILERARNFFPLSRPLVFLSEIYGLHSLRAGGASAAANAHITDRLFKRHGRWKSDKAKDGYIKDNIASLLSVSLSLGI